MNKKCNKYEQLFVFGDENDLMKHIENCPDCKSEHEKMLKVSSLIKEAKPYIKRQEQRLKIVTSTICGSFALFLTVSGVGIYQQQNNELLTSNYYESDVSIISEWGFPTDEYGLLLVE